MIVLRALVILMVSIFAIHALAADPVSNPAVPSYLITNDDRPPKTATSGTVFTIASDGGLHSANPVNLGSGGAAGGYFAAKRVSVLSGSSSACAFLSLGASGEVSVIDLQSLRDIGNYPASVTDSGIDNGTGLVNNGTYLYASFSTSNTIGTFAILPGCGLQFLSDISPIGKHGASVKGMAVHGDMLIVAYGDGSIESFNTAAGAPVSNGDLQDATGRATDRYPTGVDITEDGHFAVFGDMATNTTVEVSDISSGKLTKTNLYTLGIAGNSNNVLLSPDGTLLYITNTGSGQVTAAFFDKTTGKVTPGCTTPHLRGFDTGWVFMGALSTQRNSGTGSTLYVAEYGTPSGIGVVNVASSAGKCTLTEAAHSPVLAPNTTTLLSIGVYPPRQY